MSPTPKGPRPPVARMPFPHEGVNENWGFEQQPFLSSRDGANVDSQDPTNRRIRGAQRAGMEDYVTTPVNGALKIQDLGFTAINRKQVDYTENDASEEVTTEETATPGNEVSASIAGENVRHLKVDSQGNVYALYGDSAIGVYSSDLEFIQTINIPVVSAIHQVRAFEIDIFGCLYAGVSEASDASDGVDVLLFKWRRVPDSSDFGFQYELAWQIPSGFTTSALGVDEVPVEGSGGDFYITDIFYNPTDDRIYTSQDDAAGAQSHVVVYGGLDRLDPLMAGRFLLQDPDAGPAFDFYPTRAISVRSDGASIVSHPEFPIGTGATSLQSITLWQGTGEYLDVWNLAAGGNGGYGYGHTLIRDNERSLITAGPKNALGGGMIEQITVGVDAFVGTGTSFSEGDYGTDESHFGNPQQDQTWIRMAQDENGTVYVPWVARGETPTDANTMLVVRTGQANALLEYIALEGAMNTIGNKPLAQGAFAIAVPPRVPDYEGDISESNETAEFAYLALEAQAQDGSGTHTTLNKVRLVSADAGMDGPRETKYLAVSGGDLFVLDATGDTALPPATDEHPLLTPSQASYVESVNLLSKRYYTNGIQYGVYDPRADSFEKLKASRGSLPNKCRLISAFRNRLIFARSAGLDGPHNWFMGRTGQPTDWDENPAVATRADAITGNNLSGPLTCPDIITSLIPWDNDLLLFGCDRSFYALRGDPRQAGELDNITTEVGVAFGRPWTRDRMGRLWFIDSEGGLGLMTNPLSAGFERVSLNKLERRLRDVDQSTHYYRLAWDNELEGVHIMVFPFDVTGAGREHWFFSTRTNAFWPFTTSAGSPSAIAAFESDLPDDRTIVMGFGDSRVRKMSATAKTDAGSNIDSFVTYGPWAPRDTGEQWRFEGLNIVLAGDQGSVQYEVFAIDRPDSPLQLAQASGVVHPGRFRTGVSVAGALVYVRLRDAGPERWAVEDVYWDSVQPIGRKV